MPDLSLDSLDEDLRFFWIGVDDVFQGFGEQAHGGQGRAQFVGDVGDKVASYSFQPPQFAQVFDDYAEIAVSYRTSPAWLLGSLARCRFAMLDGRDGDFPGSPAAGALELAALRFDGLDGGLNQAQDRRIVQQLVEPLTGRRIRQTEQLRHLPIGMQNMQFGVDDQDRLR